MKTKLLLIMICGFMLPSLSYSQALTYPNIGYGSSGNLLTGDANFVRSITAGGTPYGIGLQDNSSHFNTFIGLASFPSGNATTTGIINVAVGGLNFTNLTTGSFNVAIGANAEASCTTGSDNVAIGDGADGSGSIDSFTVAVGKNALNNNTGFKNTAVGYQALGENTTGVHSAALGFETLLLNTSGTDNIGIGYDAGGSNTTGSYNIYLGSYGALGGDPNHTGNYNTYLGANAGPDADGYTNSTALGNGATVTSSNAIELGNCDVTFTGLNGAAYSSSYSLIIGCSNGNGNGAYCDLTGVWSAPSSISYKTDFTALDGNDIIKKINQLDVEGWRYKGSNVFHIGPFAGQFYRLFHTGLDSMHISYVDPAGVALLGVKQLIKYNTVKDSMIAQQQQQLANQQSEIDQLNVMVSKLDQALSQCCTNYQSTTGVTQTSSGNINTNNIPSLNQNIPNPFSQNTTISCYVPTTAQNASLVVYNLEGQVLKSFTVPVTGFNQITITSNTLPAGNYLYTLFVNGRKIDTKTMILTH